MKPGMSKPAQQHRERRRGSVYPRALPIGAEMLGDINYDLLSKNLPSLGKLRRKRNLGCPCSSDSLCYISLSHLTILTYSSIPWRLGVGLSFQVIGFVLGVMNQCFLSLAPKSFLFEARYGPSYLQDEDAILRNSFMIPIIHPTWPLILLIIAILPVGLSLTYRDFDGGTSHIGVNNRTGRVYSSTAPPGLQESGTGGIGLSLMANAVLSFYSAHTKFFYRSRGMY